MIHLGVDRGEKCMIHLGVDRGDMNEMKSFFIPSYLV
jgi:hypothetical protein